MERNTECHGHPVPNGASIVQEGESIGRKSALIFALEDIWVTQQ